MEQKIIYIQYLINQPTITFKILITYKMEVEGSVEYCGSLARQFSVKKKELFPLIRDNFSIERIYEKRNSHDILYSNAYES